MADEIDYRTHPNVLPSGKGDQLDENARDIRRRSALRDAFAQLLMQGSKGAVPMEAVWAQQGPGQFRQPARPGEADIIRDELEANGLVVPNESTTIRRFPPNPDFDVRQAMPGLGRSDNPWRVDNEPPPAPFGGKGEVVGPYRAPGSYELPKKPKKKKGKD